MAVHPIKKSSAAPITFIDVKGVRVYPEFITEDYFNGLPRNTKQRNEAIRPAAHLRDFMPEHCVVAIVRDQKGVDTKADGHTRSYLAEKGKLRSPGYFLAIVYEVIDRTLDVELESQRIYDSYDSRSASKKATDEIQGAMNAGGISFKTDWLIKGTFSNILSIASSFMPASPQGSSSAIKSKRVAYFRDQLDLLDGITPRSSQFPSGFGAGVIMFLREYGAKGLPTVINFNNGTGGLEVDGKQNGLSRLQAFLKSERKAGLMAGDANNKRQAVTTYELLDLAMRNSSVNGRVNVFDAAAYAARIS